MKILTAVAAAAVLALVPAAPAGAGTYNPGTGSLCGFTSASDPTRDHPFLDYQAGQVYGGPFTVTDDAGDPARGWLVCGIQIGEPLATGIDMAGASASGFGAVALAPTAVSFTVPPGEDVYLCTSFSWPEGPQLYWADSGDALGSGYWTPDVNAPCRLASAVKVVGVGAMYSALGTAYDATR
jgi:hypothetical protein